MSLRWRKRAARTSVSLFFTPHFSISEGVVVAPYLDSFVEEQGHTDADSDDMKEEQYEDEEQFATVTVVEEFDPLTLIHGGTTLPTEHKDKPATAAAPVLVRPPRTKTTSKLETKGKVGERRTVRYETASARKAEQRKQRARHSKKQARAGKKR